MFESIDEKRLAFDWESLSHAAFLSSYPMRKADPVPSNDRMIAISYLEMASADAMKSAEEARRLATTATLNADTKARFAGELQGALEIVKRSASPMICNASLITTPKNKSKIQRASGDSGPTGTAEKSKRSHIMAAIGMVPEEFDSLDVFAWLGQNAPSVTMPRDYVHTILWKLSNGTSPCLKVIGKGGNGRRTRYRRLRTP